MKGPVDRGLSVGALTLPLGRGGWQRLSGGRSRAEEGIVRQNYSEETSDHHFIMASLSALPFLMPSRFCRAQYNRSSLVFPVIGDSATGSNRAFGSSRVVCWQTLWWHPVIDGEQVSNSVRNRSLHPYLDIFRPRFK